MTRKKIPQTDSVEELARFWDENDFTEFEGEMDEVTEPLFERKRAVTVRLEPTEARAVHGMAKSLGIDEETLVHQWILEKIK